MQEWAPRRSICSQTSRSLWLWFWWYWKLGYFRKATFWREREGFSDQHAGIFMTWIAVKLWMFQPRFANGWITLPHPQMRPWFGYSFLGLSVASFFDYLLHRSLFLTFFPSWTMLWSNQKYQKCEFQLQCAIERQSNLVHGNTKQSWRGGAVIWTILFKINLSKVSQSRTHIGKHFQASLNIGNDHITWDSASLCYLFLHYSIFIVSVLSFILPKQ